jgi:hypothetical protein
MVQIEKFAVTSSLNNWTSPAQQQSESVLREGLTAGAVEVVAEEERAGVAAAPFHLVASDRECLNHHGWPGW